MTMSKMVFLNTDRVRLHVYEGRIRHIPRAGEYVRLPLEPNPHMHLFLVVAVMHDYITNEFHFKVVEEDTGTGCKDLLAFEDYNRLDVDWNWARS